MADPGIQAFQASSESLSGAPIPFRFEVTWRSLTEPLKPAPPDQSNSKPLTFDTGSGRLSRPAPARDAEAREWEMVLPRMRRPAALALTTPREPLQLAAPQFAMATEPTQMRRWIGLAGVAFLLVAGLAGYQRLRDHSSSEDSTVVSGMEMGGAGWITEWASDSTGSARGRQISLYRPSIPMSDYRLEFLGRIDRKSLGWVFRAADSSNYYAAKLEAVQPVASSLTITRFAVVHGFEGIHIQRTLRLNTSARDLLKVRLEARGPRFTVYVQNQVAEDWEDDRLKSGGLGFLNEREERGQIQSIQLAFPKGGTR
jgi:hypothetical protein